MLIDAGAVVVTEKLGLKTIIIIIIIIVIVVVVAFLWHLAILIPHLPPSKKNTFLFTYPGFLDLIMWPLLMTKTTILVCTVATRLDKRFM